MRLHHRVDGLQILVTVDGEICAAKAIRRRDMPAPSSSATRLRIGLARTYDATS